MSQKYSDAGRHATFSGIERAEGEREKVECRAMKRPLGRFERAGAGMFLTKSCVSRDGLNRSAQQVLSDERVWLLSGIERTERIERIALWPMRLFRN